MIKSHLIALKDFILSKNTYFDKAFDFAEQNHNGIICAYDESGNAIEIFPMDTFGNYFYLRLANKVGFDESAFYQVSECKKGAGLVANIFLVACMRKADNDKLVNNLVNTLVNYQPDKIKLISVEYHSEAVTAQELAKIPKEDLQAALQKLDMNYTIVCINFAFSMSVPYYKNLTCIEPPCSTC